MQSVLGSGCWESGHRQDNDDDDDDGDDHDGDDGGGDDDVSIITFPPQCSATCEGGTQQR